MKTIYKYKMPFCENPQIKMHVGAEVLRVAGIDGFVYIWAIVDTDLPLEMRQFYAFKTGAEMPDDIYNYSYLGCGAIFIQMELMLYVFEKHNVVDFAQACSTVLEINVEQCPMIPQPRHKRQHFSKDSFWE